MALNVHCPFAGRAASRREERRTKYWDLWSFRCFAFVSRPCYRRFGVAVLPYPSLYAGPGAVSRDGSSIPPRLLRIPGDPRRFASERPAVRGSGGAKPEPDAVRHAPWKALAVCIGAGSPGLVAAVARGSRGWSRTVGGAEESPGAGGTVGR